MKITYIAQRVPGEPLNFLLNGPAKDGAALQGSIANGETLDLDVNMEREGHRIDWLIEDGIISVSGREAERAKKAVNAIPAAKP